MSSRQGGEALQAADIPRIDGEGSQLHAIARDVRRMHGPMALSGGAQSLYRRIASGDFSAPVSLGGRANLHISSPSRSC